MRIARLLCGIGLASGVLFLSSHLVAARNANDQDNRNNGRLPHYKLIDLGTLGGPHGYSSSSGDGARLINNDGVVGFYADLNQPDPSAPDNCFDLDCLLAHVVRWKDGVLTDLGSFPGNNNSAVSSINERGWVTGFSQTGGVDPNTGFLLNHAVLWKHHEMIDVGDLGGGQSIAIYAQNDGRVVGLSTNTVPDPFAFIPFGFQIRTFLWNEGHLQDIGTLGGPDAIPSVNCSNQRDDFIVGQSYTGFTPNPGTGIPTADPFLWRHGHMIDLGSLGGTIGFAQCANNREQVIGASNLPGDITTHGFIWDDGLLKDLGTLGGDNSEAVWINDSGEIAGSADLPGSTLHDAVLWKNGVIHDLGTVDGDPCSRGRAINSRGQVVGGSSDCANFLHAFVWEKRTGMLDLNQLIAPGSVVQLTNAVDINDRGEIIAKSFPIGTTPNDDEDLGHLVLLVPCDNDHEKGCRESDFNSGANDAAPIYPRVAVSATRHPTTARENAAAWRARWARHYRSLGGR